MRLPFARLSLVLAAAVALLAATAVVPLSTWARTETPSTPVQSSDEKENAGGPKIKPCKDKEKEKKGDDKDNGRDKERCLPRGGSSSGIARGDFNGDTFADLAVGVPDEDLDGVEEAGAVHIIYGSSTGLSATARPGDQFFTESNILVGGGFGISPDSLFGSALASGDFNRDGFSDLAIGAPGLKNHSTISDCSRYY